MLGIALNAAPALVNHFNSLRLISVTMLFLSGGQFLGEMRFAYIIIRLKLYLFTALLFKPSNAAITDITHDGWEEHRD